tara:strand:+ start:1445 stop:2071 length:627 start_codon:yes stop_codon:yes gene_type:complete
MNKLFVLFILFIISFLANCDKDNKVQYKQNNFVINDFKMNHYSSKGEKLYSIVSPISIYDKFNFTYQLSNTNIKFFDKNILSYEINSNNANVLNNKQLELNGNINITDKNNNTVIKSKVLYWNIDKSEIILNGDVTLVNTNVRLNSGKAVLNRNKNIITFYKPVKYDYIDKKVNKSLYIKSENAIYNLTNNNVIFRSSDDKVKSKILF